LGKNIFHQLPQLIDKKIISGKVLLVIDKNVNKHYSDFIQSTFKNSDFIIKQIVITSTEKNKSFSTLQKIHSTLIKNNFGRDSTIVAIGGGIVGDIAGFAAATYMRGIKYIQVPTTLLSSVDSSVGGKTGINFNETKNVIGSFYQPELVLIDTDFFNTLPQEEMLCGLGEITKYCYLTNKSFFNYVEKNTESILANDQSIINKVIVESLKFKGSVVEADEKESGIRKVLNLGHTFAHAYEVDQNHKLKHGQAVIVGITSALYLSQMLNLISEKEFKKYLHFQLTFADKIKLRNVDKKNLLKVMARDKKNKRNEIKFVLLCDIGNILTDVPAPKNLIVKAIEKSIKHFQ
jgi:3-dehydroquinate synthase